MALKDDLTGIVGAENIIDGDGVNLYVIAHALDADCKSSYVVLPKTAGEVQGIVKLANTHKLPLMPYSSGMHLFNNSVSFKSGIIVDLNRMDRIISIDERNRMARIEPGVTWGKLQSELAKYNLMANPALFPHPLKSALTIYLEREPRLIPKFEYTDPTVTMEVVLPSGELFRTGSASVPGFPDKCLSQGVNPSGPGDFMWNRLFEGAQGTLGIVTWANCKIEYKPAVNKTFFIPFSSALAAARFIYKIQRHEIGEECFLLNDTNLASILTEKWPEDYSVLKKSLASWTVILVLGGGKRFPGERIAYEEKALLEVAGELSLTPLSTTLPALPDIENRFPEMLRGSWPAQNTYWKFALKGCCRDLFFLTRLNQIDDMCGAIKDIALKYKYPVDELGFYVQPMVYGGACHFECNMYFNNGNAAEADRIRKFYMEAAVSMLNRGAFYNRPYGPIADMVFSKNVTYSATLKRLKNELDPNAILSPGRLCF